MPTRTARPDLASSTAMPLHKVLRSRQEEIPDLTNAEIARRLGYPRPNVIAMMMTGSMSVPLAKVPDLAAALELDPLWLLRRVAQEQMPEAWAVIEAVICAERLVTPEELELLKEVRVGLLGEALEPHNDERFMTGLHELLAEAVERHSRSALATRIGAGVKSERVGSRERRELLDLLRRHSAERRSLRASWAERRSTSRS